MPGLKASKESGEKGMWDNLRSRESGSGRTGLRLGVSRLELA